MKYEGIKELEQNVFTGQPVNVDWCGVDYDGTLSFGIAVNPRYTYGSEQWRGFEQIGGSIRDSGFKPLTSLKRTKFMKQENLFTPDCIRTYTGQYVKVVDPDLDTLVIEDIAHSLSNQYRFGGHLPVQYTVAQHCVMCANFTKGDKFEALMHDATEAYMLDMGSPVKKHLPDYQRMERNLASVLAKKFGFGYPFSKETKEVDGLMLQWEWDTYMIGPKPYFGEVWTSDKAQEEFLKLFHKLTSLRAVSL